jgi:general stress protein YciG
MAGNKIGGRKAADKNLEKDPDFYRRIGAMGGSKSTTGGFYANPELARRAGSIGGKISKRGKKVTV